MVGYHIHRSNDHISAGGFIFMEHSAGRVPVRTRFYYGWLMVAIGGIGIFFSGPGQTYTNSVFIESYVQDFSLSQTVVASIYSTATLISGLLIFFMGRLADRFGRRIMLTMAALLLGLSCFYNSIVSGPIMLFIGFFLLRYFGQGSLTLIPNTLVSQWFVRYRGRALSFAGIGGIVGGAAFPPLVNMLIERYGWQDTWLILGAALVLFFAPLSYYLVRNQPEDIGLLPDGATVRAEVEEEAAPAFQEDAWTLSEAVRTRAFWYLMICSAIPAMIYTGITFQFFSMMSLKDIDRQSSAYVLSLIPIISFSFSLMSGFMVEKVKANRLLSTSFGLSILMPCILMVADNYPSVILFAVLWGATQGMINIPMGVLWPSYFGRKHLGSIQGVTTTAMVIGSALGPIPFGWAYDTFGDYNVMLIISALIWGIGALLAFLAVQPRRNLQ